MKKKIAISSVVMFMPFLVLAQTPNFGVLTGIVNGIGGLVTILTPIVVALALLFFFWGLAKYILSAGDEESKAAGKNIMIWGIIALFVMISVWGLVQFLGATFGIDQGATITPPKVTL